MSENNYVDNVNEVGRKEPSYRDASNETLSESENYKTVEGIMSGGERDDEADAVSEVADEGMI